MEGELLMQDTNPSEHTQFIDKFNTWAKTAAEWNWPERPEYQAVREHIFNTEIKLSQAVVNYRNLWDNYRQLFGEEKAAFFLMSRSDRDQRIKQDFIVGHLDVPRGSSS